MNFLSVVLPCEDMKQLSVNNNSTNSPRIKSHSTKSYGHLRDDMSEKSKKKGMCYLCGKVKTHRKKNSPFHGVVMEPVTIDGEVFEGYCLVCHAMDEILVCLNKTTTCRTKNSTNKLPGNEILNNSPSKENRTLKKQQDIFIEQPRPLERSSNIQCTASIDTQPTFSSVETNISTPPAQHQQQQQQLGKPPLQPRTRITIKDLDLLDYSSAEDESSSSVFDCGSSLGSWLRLTQSEDSIELALPRSTESITSEMKEHPADATVQEFGCTALGQLKVEQLHHCSTGGKSSSSVIIEVILTAILLHGPNVRIIEECVRTLRRLTFKASKCENSANVSIDKRHLDKDTCAKMERRGGIRLALNALKYHPNHKKIQRDSLRTVRNILSCSSHSTTATASTSAKIDHDSVQAFIQAMLTHGEIKALQEDGCALLWILVFNDPSYQKKIVEMKGIDAAIRALAMQREVEQVHYHGCGFLHVLSCNEEFKARLLEAGALNFAFRSMDEHGYSPLVSDKACSILAALMVRKSGETKLCVMQKQEVESIVRLMNIHSNSRRVQKSALRTLELAARARSNLAILKACKSLRSVVRAAANAFPEDCSRSAGQLMSSLDNR